MAHVLDRPVPKPDRTLSPDQQRWLATIARRTWLYFERFVGPDDHWLPPDHFQESPRGDVAHRTSPTNIGLLLATTVGAHDAGFLGARDLLLRLGNTFATLDRLERHRGHFLNWYDTRTLRPLHPKYVSTVDSGNLLGLLVVVRLACLEVGDGPVLRWRRLEGLRTLVDLLNETAEALQDDDLTHRILAFRDRIERAEDRPETWSPLIDELSSDALPDLERTLLTRVRTGVSDVGHEQLADLGIWLGRLQLQVDTMREGRDTVLPWLRPDAHVAALAPVLDALPTHLAYRDLPAAYRTVRDALNELGPADDEETVRRTRLRSALDAADEVVVGLHRDADALAAHAERYLQETHLDFLFDPERKLFRIGYHVDDDREDVHSYDLLASEARIASFMAIALDRVEPSHWLHLGRPTAVVDGTQVLLSWSGTMFEYLMPTLFMRTPEHSLLAHACRTAIERQIAFGREHGVPWGTSESGYARTDAQHNYQYRAFGVPDLALSHEATGRQVVAPYATLMALPWAPHDAAENLDRLVAAGALGRYGFYEALDYSHARLGPGDPYTVVRSFMVHHHGMAFMALCNVLHGDRFIERFHADARVQTNEILLHEHLAPVTPDERIQRDDGTEVVRPRFHAPPVEPWDVPVRTHSPEVHALSNGRYTLFLTNAGAGASRWEGLDLTRWRSDPTCDAWGQWTYVQDLDLLRTWSATPRPVDAPGQDARVTFHSHQVTFHRRDGDVSTRLEVIVPPRDDAEIRRVTLINHGDTVRRLAVTSYGEVALAPHGADLRHPAFAKMFVECSWRAEDDGLLFRRRLRSTNDAPAYLVHRLVHEHGDHPPPEVETDRERFLGRHGHAGDPAGLRAPRLSGTLGSTLDPVFALRTRVEIPPHATVRMSFVTIAGGSARSVLDVARRYGQRDRIEAAFLDAGARQNQVAARVGLDTAESASADRLLSRLLYSDASARADTAILRSNVSGPSGLWTHGISGDHPILLLRLRSVEDVDTVRTLLKIHRLWRSQRFVVDLVILNELDQGYVQTTRDAVRRLVASAGDEVWQDRPGGIFVLSAAHMDESSRVLLQAAARVVVNDSAGSELVAFPTAPKEGLPALEPSHRRPDHHPDTPPLPRPTDLRFDNGWGGFTPDGREYVTYLQERSTPAPWINVLANTEFGCLVSEAGSSTTWSVNSGENRLSPWSNDPVGDPSGEVLYLRDEETTDVWTPTPQPIPAGLPYRVRHGHGHTTFEHRSHGLDQSMEVFVLDDAPVKVVRLRLTNLLARPRRITATYYLAWVLGHARESSGAHVIPEYDADLGALLARNPFREAFAHQVAFLAGDRPPHGVTADRREFLGRDGSTRRPAALARIGLSGRVEAGSDPCAALQLHVDLAAGASDEVAFLVGVGEDREAAKELVRRHRGPDAVALGRQNVSEAWERRLGTVRVRTPDPAMDLMLNGWLLYQSLVCRMWGRSAFYQSSGAFGFRDQLQDSMALLHVDPATAREQLLQAARHQFEQGDVLHWWLPHEGRGVRTRISDDLVWLPFVTAHYVEGSGDAAVLDERVPFLRAPELAPDEHERFDRFPSTEEAFPLYVHACRALDRAATRGAHGLPLMDGGDWNDGMNRVGADGRGESVWLAWFLITTLERFAPLCDARGEPTRAERYREQADAYRRAIEAHAWDGDWYLRAFYDDGTPLGSHAGDEARIDAIAQAWSVLAGPTDPERSARAMASVREHLVREEDGLVLLLAPPFDRGEHDPGYIKGYPPGVRENGGQYTHAALWFALACARSGDGDGAHALFDRLNPLRHASDAESAARYRLEPYVVAADVYGVAPHVGRGGWSWYTGSAAWMYRLGLEAILGIRREGAALVIEPCIPAAWKEFEIDYRYGATWYRIQVENPHGVSRGVHAVELDGAPLPTPRLPLVDDGVAHAAVVRMGAADEA
ncbi:MAG: glucoamylase family protein [Trueperaceae bacterium]